MTDMYQLEPLSELQAPDLVIDWYACQLFYSDLLLQNRTEHT